MKTKVVMTSVIVTRYTFNLTTTARDSVVYNYRRLIKPKDIWF